MLLGLFGFSNKIDTTLEKKKKTGEWHNNVESVVMIKVGENEERGKFGRV